MNRWSRVVRYILLAVMQAAVCIGGPSCLGPGRNHSPQSQPARAMSSAAAKTDTTISAHLGERIEPGRNVIWCGAFQLAWNEAIRHVGEVLRLKGEPPLATELNRQEFTREWVDEANCVAIADTLGNNVYDRIERELRAKASAADARQYRPDHSYAVRPQDIVAYAYLQADLEFASPFENLDDRLVFQGVGVRAFGIGPDRKAGRERLYTQVWVHDYNGPDDFIVELDSRLKGHRLILARVMPEDTLRATIQAVEARLTTPPATRDLAKLTVEQAEQVGLHVAAPGDVLIIPKMTFALRRVYDELIDRRLLTDKPGIAQDLRVLDAVQDILFEMDEEGVKLRSAAQMSLGCAAAAPLPAGRLMVFDGPFLVMLQRNDAPTPYFAAWIGNPQLLQKRES